MSSATFAQAQKLFGTFGLPHAVPLSSQFGVGAVIELVTGALIALGLFTRGAAFIARRSVYWFHTTWVASDSGMHVRRSWLIRVGDSCACRCLIEWSIERRHPWRTPVFTRGPAIKYNRWLGGARRLPFEVPE